MNINIEKSGHKVHATVFVPEANKGESYTRIYTSDILIEVEKRFEERVGLLSGPQFVDNKFGANSAEWIFEISVPAEDPPPKPRRGTRKKVQKKLDINS